MRGAYDASVVDKPDYNRSLSFLDSSTKLLFCVRRVQRPRPQGRILATAAFALCDHSPHFCDRRPFLCRRANFLCRRANFFCRRRPHAARPRHPPFRSCRRLNPPKLPPIARHSAVHRFAILCQPMRTSDRRVRPYWRSRLFVPAIPFNFTTHLVYLFREALPGRLCSIPPRTMQRCRPYYEARYLGGSCNSVRRLFAIE